MDLIMRMRGRVVMGALAPFLAPHHKVLGIGCGNGIVSEQNRDRFKYGISGTDILNYLRTDTLFRRLRNGLIDSGPREFEVGPIINASHHIKLDC